MKDKEKQIEEMAKDIVKMAGLDVYDKAKYLYEQGYRKTDKGSVVLTKEEFWKLSNKFSKKELDEIVEFHKNKASKETVEKILQKIKDSFWMNSNNCYALKLWIEQQFGVEIKE
jgi:hypothetical protein